MYIHTVHTHIIFTYSGETINTYKNSTLYIFHLTATFKAVSLNTGAINITQTHIHTQPYSFLSFP